MAGFFVGLGSMGEELVRFDKIAGRPLSHIPVLSGTDSSLNIAILDSGA